MLPLAGTAWRRVPLHARGARRQHEGNGDVLRPSGGAAGAPRPPMRAPCPRSRL